MYEPKSPPEKIQALFFQALHAADPKLKPSDIQVTVTPDELAATNTMFANTRRIKIDLSQSKFGSHVAGMCFGLMNFGGMWRSDPKNGIIEYKGDGLMEKAEARNIQAAIAGSMTMDHTIAEALGNAAQAAGFRR
jgi:hypothetical protein